jgi:hypothetical protein
MEEHEFDALFQQPYKREDAMGADAQMRRCDALGFALWGRKPEDLQRQLLAPYPEIPLGFTLTDFRLLQKRVEAISALSSDRRHAWLSRLQASAGSISVGGQRFTAWEARCEVVRRAIAYLEKH